MHLPFVLTSLFKSRDQKRSLLSLTLHMSPEKQSTCFGSVLPFSRPPKIILYRFSAKIRVPASQVLRPRLTFSHSPEFSFLDHRIATRIELVGKRIFNQGTPRISSEGVHIGSISDKEKKSGLTRCRHRHNKLTK